MLRPIANTDQVKLICSKSTMETPKPCTKSVQSINKDTRTTSLNYNWDVANLFVDGFKVNNENNKTASMKVLPSLLLTLDRYLPSRLEIKFKVNI